MQMCAAMLLFAMHSVHLVHLTHLRHHALRILVMHRTQCILESDGHRDGAPNHRAVRRRQHNGSALGLVLGACKGGKERSGDQQPGNGRSKSHVWFPFYHAGSEECALTRYYHNKKMLIAIVPRAYKTNQE